MSAARPERVLIVGAGLMGSQIGCEYALAGHRVSLVARDAARVGARVHEALSLVRSYELAGADNVEIARGNITVAGAGSMSADPPPHIIVESLPEDLGVKRDVLVRLVAAVPDAIIASNTSSIPITELGLALDAPDRTIGTHYWNPPLLMPPVEVIPGRGTLPAVVDRVTAVLRGMKKEPVLVQRDVDGFIWNRLQNALLREALWLVENNVATPETIDTVVRSGLARRSRYTGPFQTIALGGVAAWQSIATNIFPHLSNEKAPSDLSKWVELERDTIDATKQTRDAALARELIEETRMRDGM